MGTPASTKDEAVTLLSCAQMLGHPIALPGRNLPPFGQGVGILAAP